MPKSFPFPYVGEGIAAARKTMSVFVGFTKTAKKKSALAKLPSILTHVTWHTPTLLEVAHVGELQWAVARTYPRRGPRAEEGEATIAQWTAFNRAMDRWLVDVHAKQPVAFAIKPADDEYGTSFGVWHRYENLGQLNRDPDLGELRTWPKLKALFASRRS